jgi:putative CocE/NonD family hydrolase
MKRLFSHSLLLALLSAFTFTHAQNEVSDYTKTEVMIPMRDGIKLNTAIYAPKNAPGPLPIIFRRTPYGISNAANSFKGSFKELADDGYIFVFQDNRGRYGSEGQFVMQRLPRDRRDPKAIDEGSDAYDTIEWVLKNVPKHNGRVGMLGVSYDGWLTVMALIDPHPALKCASPQASPADMYLGDDFHHNGAFRLSYGFEYAALMETGKTSYQFQFDRYDTYEWYLRLGPLARVNEKYFQGKLPTWNDFVAHPNYDEFWQRQAAAPYLKRVPTPTLNVAGWWDQEDYYGPLKIYETLEKNDKENHNFLVVGPWNHGGWNRESSNLGKINFEKATGVYYREQIQAPWFAHYLKDRPFSMPEAMTFETGANEWRRDQSWPPRARATERNLYFHGGGKLSFDPPVEDKAAFDSYLSDPAHPVPYRPRPIEPTYYPRGSGWPAWLVEDQRFVHARPDVLSYVTEDLAEDVVVAGEAFADLFASTTGSDADWIVKLIDVYPEEYVPEPKMGGYQLMVANEVFRGRFRKSFEKPEALVPNQVAEFNFSLHSLNHRFRKGHRIMVQVQSTWFPVIDRNPQKFIPNIFMARAEDYIAATQRIYRSPQYRSHLKLSMAK